MSLIPEEIKGLIKAYGESNILAIIGDRLPLKKHGTVHKACCPFHGEKTPSFSVNPATGRWRCFGCGEGGDVASFFMKLDGITYPAALELIARRGGIEIPTGMSREEKEKRALLHILNKAQTFFTNALSANRNGAQAYVMSRMTDEQVTTFGIGFAPPGGKALTEYFLKEKVDMELAVKAGLLRKGEDIHRDVFWGRMMFPIKSKSGHIIAFAGRQVSSAPTECKYVNSPETPLFLKKEILYGLDLALAAMKETGEAFVVEGYTDLISMRAAGIPNVVAACGTSFTEEHAAVLKRYVQRLNLMFDGDAAGQRALQKSILLTIQEEMKAYAYIFPEEEDPDSYFKAGGQIENLDTMSGLEYLKQKGVEMSPNLQALYRGELAERALLYMAQNLPSVARILAKRGNLGEIFSPEVMPLLQGVIPDMT